MPGSFPMLLLGALNRTASKDWKQTQRNVRKCVFWDVTLKIYDVWVWDAVKILCVKNWCACASLSKNPTTFIFQTKANCFWEFYFGFNISIISGKRKMKLDWNWNQSSFSSFNVAKLWGFHINFVSCTAEIAIWLTAGVYRANSKLQSLTALNWLNFWAVLYWHPGLAFLTKSGKKKQSKSPKFKPPPPPFTDKHETHSEKNCFLPCFKQNGLQLQLQNQIPLLSLKLHLVQNASNLQFCFMFIETRILPFGDWFGETRLFSSSFSRWIYVSKCKNSIFSQHHTFNIFLFFSLFSLFCRNLPLTVVQMRSSQT